MTDKEKAKAYDEVLKQIKECIPDENGFITIYPQEIFPELAESNDERIRKALIDGFTVMKESKNCGKTFSNHNIPVSDIIAWLEKQQKPTWSREDERIRKELLEHCKNQAEPYIQTGNKYPQIQSWIDWLEKQKDCIKLSDSAYTSNKDVIEFADKYSHAVWENLMDKFKKIENYSIGCNDVSDIVLNAIINTYNWLEKQSKQKQLYIRFGEIPTDEKSKIYRGEIEVGTENGVSVYPAFKTDEGDIVLGLSLPITKTTLYTQQHLIEYDNRPCYLVNGDYIGKDTDGQPLINNISIIKKIDSYRVKEEKQTEQEKDILEDAILDGYILDGNEDGLIAETIRYKHEKQGEQKPANKVEPIFNVGDKIQYLKGCSTIMTIEKIENGEYIFANNMGHTTIENGNKWYLVEQKPAWSEEDEIDKEILNAAILFAMNSTDEFACNGVSKEDVVNWLQSLRPQNKWKQSDEQIKALNIEKACDAFCKVRCQDNPPRSTCTSLGTCREYDDFRKAMKEEGI